MSGDPVPARAQCVLFELRDETIIFVDGIRVNVRRQHAYGIDDRADEFSGVEFRCTYTMHRASGDRGDGRHDTAAACAPTNIHIPGALTTRVAPPPPRRRSPPTPSTYYTYTCILHPSYKVDAPAGRLGLFHHCMRRTFKSFGKLIIITLQPLLLLYTRAFFRP